MKLYLSSYGLGNQPSAFVNLLGKNKLGAIIMNAQDHKDETSRKERYDKELSDLSNLGLKAEELDLREYFGKESKLKETLNKYGFVWIRGGNVFVLMRAMKSSGFNKVIKPLLEDELVYAGYSAGPVAATPDFHGIENVDDPNIVPDGYSKDIVWQGLGLIDYYLAPHYRSEHPESEAIENTIEYFKKHKMKYKTLIDGQAIVIKDNVTEIME